MGAVDPELELELVDYGGGNLGSLRRCLQRLEVPFREVDSDRPPSGQHPVVLPGVGAFGAVVRGLRRGGLDQRLIEVIRAGTPFLGICVGLQVLFESSQEDRDERGLGLLQGTVARFDADKVPQIGWNRVAPGPAGDGWPEGHVYFVNSYHALPADPAIELYHSHYGGRFCAAVKRANITAFQFHPEKSGPFGHELVARWLREVG